MSRRRSIRRILDNMARRAGQGLPGQARQQDDQRLAQGHHLRRAEGRLPPPQHDEGERCWPATRCCSSRNIIRSAAASSSGRAISRRRRTRRNIPIRRWRKCSTHTKRDKISLAQLAYANELAISGSERGGDRRLPRQDPRRDARDREDRARAPTVDAARADQAQDQGRRRLQERDERSRSRHARRSAWFRPPRSPARKKMRAAIWSSPRPPADRRA